ncbi:MAG: hypothetical protein QOC96_973, partial [Acidobacteriota bacterium]|nr:hypothetical protein [Acidobacteriota bacterium]
TPPPISNAVPYPQYPQFHQGQYAVSSPQKRRPPIPWSIPIILVVLFLLASTYVGSVLFLFFGLLIAILLSVVNLIAVRLNARSIQSQPGYTPPPINNAVLYPQPSQFSQEQPPSLIVPRRSYVLALVGNVIACIFGFVLVNEFLFTRRHYDLVIRHFVYETNNLPPATALYLLSYGALALLFGYKWPQGGWKWSLWLTAIPAILLTIGAFGAPPVDKDRFIYFLQLFLPLLLSAAFLGALLGSKIGRRKRAR